MLSLSYVYKKDIKKCFIRLYDKLLIYHLKFLYTKTYRANKSKDLATM